MRFPIQVKSRLDHSDALDAHVEREVRRALHAYADGIARVTVALQDANGPRGGANDKVARVTVTLRPSRRVVAMATAGDIYVSVARAADRAKSAVAHRHERRAQNGIRPKRSAA